MSGNILSTVTQFFTPDLTAKLASAAGLSPTAVPKVVEAAVPAILSRIAALGAEPGGPLRLADAIAKTPPGMLNNFASKLGDESTGLVDQGKTLLSSLLGGGGVNTLASVIGKATGIGEGSVRTLLGFITPAVMGLLGRVQRAANLDETGLARMLRSQSEDFTDALPANVSGLLDSTGFFDRVAPAAATNYMQDAPRRSGAPASVAARAANGNASRHSWVYWALPLLALAGLGLYFLNSRDMSREVAQAPQATSPTRTAQTGGAPTYLTGAPDNAVPLSAYLRRTVEGPNGERLGTINEIFVQPDGRVGTMVIGVERALGIGEKEVALPFSALLISRRDDGWQLRLDASKETLQSAPRFNINDAGSRPQMPKQ